MGVGLLRPASTQSPHPHISTSATTHKQQQPHVRGQAWAPARAPQAPQGGVTPWALGSSGRPNLHVLAPTRLDAKTTTAARAWASLGAGLGAPNATRRSTSLGVGLLRPSNHPRPHPRQLIQPPQAPPRRVQDTSRTCLGALVWRKTADRRDPLAAPRHKPPAQPGATTPQEQRRSWALGTSAHRSTPSIPRRRSAVALTARAQTPAAPSLSGHSIAHSIEKLTVVITGSPQRVTL